MPVDAMNGDEPEHMCPHLRELEKIPKMLKCET